MKKYMLIMAAIGVFTIANANAGFVATTGDTVNTVAEVKSMRDDSYVVMEGKIDKRVRRDKYQFSDATGTIIVEIDNDKWYGINVTPNDTVRIYGETDKEFMRDVSVDADAIRLVK